MSKETSRKGRKRPTPMSLLKPFFFVQCDRSFKV
jgi:hypothetical protein